MKIHFKAFLLVWLVLSITPSFAFNLNDSNQGLSSDDGSLGDNGVEHYQKKVVEESISTTPPAKDSSDAGSNVRNEGGKQVSSPNLSVNNKTNVSSEDYDIEAEIELVKSNASVQALNIEAAINECSQQIENATESRKTLQAEYEASVVVESNLKVKLDDFVDCIGNGEERSALEKEYQEAQYKTKALHNRIESLDSVLKVLEKRKANYENVLKNLNSLQALDKNNYKLVLDHYKSNMSSLENLSINGSVTDDKDFYADLYAYQVSQAFSSSKVSHKKLEDLLKNDVVVLKKDNDSYVDYIFQETKVNSAGMTIVICMNANGDLIEIPWDEFKKQYTNTIIQVDWGENNPEDIINTLKLELQKQNSNTTQHDESVTLNLLTTLGLRSTSILSEMVVASILAHSYNLANPILTNLQCLSNTLLGAQNLEGRLLLRLDSCLEETLPLANRLAQIISEKYSFEYGSEGYALVLDTILKGEVDSVWCLGYRTGTSIWDLGYGMGANLLKDETQIYLRGLHAVSEQITNNNLLIEATEAELNILTEESTSVLAKAAFLDKVGEVISVVSTVIDIVTVVVICAEIAHYTYSYIESLVQFYENKKVDTTPDIRYNGINRAI